MRALVRIEPESLLVRRLCMDTYFEICIGIMRTSLDIPDSLFQRAKKLARERKTSLRALLLEGLSEVLRRELMNVNYSCS